MRKIYRNILTFSLAVIMLLSNSLSSLANNDISETKTKFYELSMESFTQEGVIRKTEDKTWACLTVNDDYTEADLQLKISDYEYETVLSGTAEKFLDGYMGFYQGKITPCQEDTQVNELLLPGEEQVIVSVDATFCGEDVFFTIVVGMVAEGVTPIVKAYGVRTEEINKIVDNYAKTAINMYQDREETSNEKIDILNQSKATSLDATVRYQTKTDFTSSSGLVLGQISMYHANELRNQNSTPVYVKVNTKNSNTNSYLRTEYSIPSSYYTSTLPVQMMISLNSSNTYSRIGTNAYEPMTSDTSYTMHMPYILSGAVQFCEIEYVLSSVKATLSNAASNGGYRKVQWNLSHSIGMSGTNGEYTSTAGQCVSAEYRYDGNISSNTSTTLSGSAYIVYRLYVENPSSGTTTTYSFTTTTKTISNSMTIVP